MRTALRRRTVGSVSTSCPASHLQPDCLEPGGYTSSAYTPRSSYVHDLKEGFMPRGVVTGVAGFIGSHLAEHLVALGHEVVGSDCFTPYYSLRLKRANLAALMAQPRFQLVEGDLSTVDLGSMLEGADYVFHQAAQAGVTGTAIKIGGGSRMMLRDVLDLLRDAVGQRAQLVY